VRRARIPVGVVLVVLGLSISVWFFHALDLCVGEGAACPNYESLIYFGVVLSIVGILILAGVLNHQFSNRVIENENETLNS